MLMEATTLWAGMQGRFYPLQPCSRRGRGVQRGSAPLGKPAGRAAAAVPLPYRLALSTARTCGKPARQPTHGKRRVFHRRPKAGAVGKAGSWRQFAAIELPALSPKESPAQGGAIAIGLRHRAWTPFQSTSTEADDMLCLGGFPLASAGRADWRGYGHVTGAHEDAGHDQCEGGEQLPNHADSPPLTVPPGALLHPLSILSRSPCRYAGLSTVLPIAMCSRRLDVV